MRITCDTKELARCLKIVSPVPGSKIWIKATGKSVKLLSESSMIAMSLALPEIMIDEPGIACLWHNDFVRIIGTSYKRKAGNVSISSGDESVTIEMDEIVYTLPLLDAELPVMRRKPKPVVKLELREPFMRLKKFILRDSEYRTTLGGIYLDNTHALKAVATDGRILKALSIKGNDPPEGFGGLISYQACVLLMDKAWDGEIAVSQDERMMWFSKPGMVMSVMTKPDYVLWQTVITASRQNPIHITVNREQLIDVVRRVDRINAIKGTPIIFNTINHGLEVGVESGDRKAWASVESLSTDDVLFYLSSEYILTCLRSMASDEVTLRVKDAESEIYIGGGADEQTMIMTMKVR